MPAAVRTSLWSYDPAQLDVEHDRQRIIVSVLNYGSDEAARWVFATYPRQDIADAVVQSDQSEWSKKSLSFWSTVLQTTPASRSRAERIRNAL